MPEIKVQCPQCQVTVRLASLPVGKSTITCPKCQGRVPLTEERPAPAPRPKRRRNWAELAPEERRGPLFGGELWGAIGLLSVCIPLTILCFFGLAAATAGLIGMWIVLLALAFWGGIWLLVIAFSEDTLQGILCLFVPFYSLYYLITRFGDCYRALVVQLGSILVVPFMIVGSIGAGASAVREHSGEIADAAQAPAEIIRRRGGGFNTPPPQVDLPKTAGKDRDDPKYLDYALEDLRSSNTQHREDGARNIGEMRPVASRQAEVVKALEEACKDPVAGVRAAALRALANWGSKDNIVVFLIALEDKDHGVARAALDFVARQKDIRAIDSLIKSLPTLHGDAAKAIRDFGPFADKPLIEAATKGTREVRAEAIDLLRDMGSLGAVPAIVECLGDSDRDIQRRAIEFFKRVKDVRAADGLAEAMAHHRTEAVDALRQLGIAAEKSVRTVAAREDFPARREALLLLKDIGTKDSVPALRDIVLKRGRDNEAAREALRGIAARFPKEFPPDKPIWEVDKTTQALADLQSTDVFKRGDALEQFLRLEPNERKDEVVKAVEPLLTDRDLNVRNKAIQIYGAWAGKDGVIKLIGFLSDQDIGTREAAIKTLGKLKDERAIAPLAARLTDFFDRKHVIVVLKDFGVKAQLEVSKYCTHTDAGVRQEATKLLGAIGDKEAIPALQKLITQKTDRALSQVATQALTELKARLAAEEKTKENEKK